MLEWITSIFSNLYGLLICSGMVLGIVAASFLSRTRGYHEDLVLWVAVICIPLAIVGARLYYIVFDDRGSDFWTFRRIIGLEDGGLQGLAIFGGILFAMIGSIFVWLIYRKKENPLDRITILQMFDLFFIFIILGQAIGRWGNYFNEEAYGYKVTDPAKQWFPFAVEIHSGNSTEWHLATFFYEFCFNIIGCGIMLWLYIGKFKSFDGFVFCFYGIWYGCNRIWIESLRTDSLMIGRVRVSQIVSGLFVLAGIIIITVHLARASSLKKKVFILVPVNKLSTDYLDFEKSRVSQPKRSYKKK